MSLLAGAAKRDISPRTPLALYGYPHVERVHQGIHDPLWASALVLKNGDTGVCLMGLDILLLNPMQARALRKDVAARVGLPEDCVLINCTHTHSGPVTSKFLAWSADETIPDPDPAYLQMMHDEAVAAAGDAADALEPAALAWTTADGTSVGGNRLGPDGAIDPEVGVLAVRSTNRDTWISLALIYGMHPTVIHEDTPLVTSDFIHYTREHLCDTFAREMVVVYHNAPCGNQSPRYFVNGQTFEEAKRLGDLLGERVESSVAALTPESFSSDIVLGGALTQVELPRRDMLSIKEAETLVETAHATFNRLKDENAPRVQVRTAECATFGAESTCTLARKQAEGAIDRLMEQYGAFDVQAVRVGGACLAGLPGELFTEYALRFKEKAGGTAYLLCLTNGDMQGYIVTEEAAAEGGYEATNSLFAPAGGERLITTAAGLVEKLRTL